MSAHERAKLSGTQQQVLYEMVVAGPLANGFDCGVWTTAMFVELIGRRWGVCYLCINSKFIVNSHAGDPKQMPLHRHRIRCKARCLICSSKTCRSATSGSRRR